MDASRILTPCDLDVNFIFDNKAREPDTGHEKYILFMLLCLLEGFRFSAITKFTELVTDNFKSFHVLSHKKYNHEKIIS